MSDNKLNVIDLHKRYGEHEVLKGVSLQAKAGDVISIIGSSGSGKSTFLRCINFLENPHEADVGYALLPEAQGKGYASEALRAICDYGFSTLGVQAINAWVLGENRGSSRLQQFLKGSLK